MTCALHRISSNHKCSDNCKLVVTSSVFKKMLCQRFGHHPGAMFQLINCYLWVRQLSLIVTSNEYTCMLTEKGSTG